MRDEFFGTDSAEPTDKTGASARGCNEYSLEPHVCRVCFSRIASTPNASVGRRLFVCTNCGASATSSTAASVCACGLKMRKGGKSGTTGALVDMGVRCKPNDAISPELPSLYVASYEGVDTAKNTGKNGISDC